MLLDQQQRLLNALLGASGKVAELAPLPAVTQERGLHAYQGNLKGLSARALASVFTRVSQQLGEDDFAAMAWGFWRHRPPTRGDLACWGDELEAFLMERAGAASGLPGLARLEWSLHVAERAADAVLDAESLQHLATTEPAALGLRLQPGLAVLAMEPQALELLGAGVSQAGSLLVWREGWRGEWRRLDETEAVFVRAVLDGRSLEAALRAASVKGLATEPDFDFGAWLQSALRHGWLIAADTLRPNELL
ncbi:MAG: putative DNA-binding domain-containing protein [Burkholderiales bacterium]